MKIDCAYNELIEIHKLVPNPKNNNRHSIEQIHRLAKIIAYQGMRSPIVVSKRSGFITKGHCRLEAIKELGWDKAPVNFQDYESEAQEYSDMTADNELARWSELDVHQLHVDLEGIDIDLDMLGLENDDFLKEIDKKANEIEVLDEDKFILLIECKNEIEQSNLFGEFQTRELNCKIMN